MSQRRKPWWKGPLCTGGLLILVGVILFGGFTFALEATNTQEFCVSCHSMKGNFEEYKKTPHFRNPSGVQAKCPDCHVPRRHPEKLIAKIMAAKDVYHEIMGTVDTPEKFEAHRWDMANRVWTKMMESNARECRSCHDFENMDMENQSRTANRKHSKAKIAGRNCIECHAGIAHKQPDAPPGATLPWETAEEESAGQKE